MSGIFYRKDIRWNHTHLYILLHFLFFREIQTFLDGEQAKARVQTSIHNFTEVSMGFRYESALPFVLTIYSLNETDVLG